MTGTRLRWAVCAVLALVAAILAGSMLFKDDPSAATTQPEPAQPFIADRTPTTDAPNSATPSVDGSDGPPRRPDAALGLTVASAEALVRFYFEQAENYLKLTGDGSAVRAV